MTAEIMDDDGRTDEGRNGIQGNHAEIVGEHTNQVAEERNYPTTQSRGRQQDAVVVGVEQGFGEMWHRQSEKANGTTEGGNDCREHTGDEQ